MVYPLNRNSRKENKFTNRLSCFIFINFWNEVDKSEGLACLPSTTAGPNFPNSTLDPREEKNSCYKWLELDLNQQLLGMLNNRDETLKILDITGYMNILTEINSLISLTYTKTFIID